MSVLHSPERRTARAGSHILYVAAVILTLGACATQRGGSDYDGSAMYSSYHNFAWMPRAAQDSDLLVRRVHEAIEAELTRKGYVQVSDASAAEFVVDFTLGSQERLDVGSYPAPYFIPDVRIYPDWWGQPYWGMRVNEHPYREGILSIDVFDAERRLPVWHGWSAQGLTPSQIEHPAEAVIRARVQAVLQSFPPM